MEAGKYYTINGKFIGYIFEERDLQFHWPRGVLHYADGVGRRLQEAATAMVRENDSSGLWQPCCLTGSLGERKNYGERIRGVGLGFL